MERLHPEYLSAVLGFTVHSVKPIQDNKYCSILHATRDDTPIIVKKYYGEETKLAKTERDGLELYKKLSEGRDGWLSGGCVVLVEAENVLAIDYIPGIALSDYLYETAKRKAFAEAEEYFDKLGSFLKELHDETKEPLEVLDPFHFEYIRYTTDRLKKSTIGKLALRGADSAETLIDRVRVAKIIPSFVHGDFVPRNIHVEQGKIGLIDFANCLRSSHPLNDLYNMFFALESMVIPGAMRQRLWAALIGPMRSIGFSDIAHEFFFEYHRRRWLMLNLTAGGKRALLRGSRGMLSFGRANPAKWPAK